MKYTLFLLLFLNLPFSSATFAQDSKEANYATIHLYRPRQFAGGLIKTMLYFNGQDVLMMPSGSKLTYKIYSEGLLHIRLNSSNILDYEEGDRVTSKGLRLNVRHGENYYIKIFREMETMVLIPVSEAVGREDFQRKKMFKHRGMYKEEDLNFPVINNHYYPDLATSTPLATHQEEAYPLEKTNESVYPSEQPSQTEEIRSELYEKLVQNERENSNAIAVVIGNKDYHGKDIPKVAYALNDARLVKEMLIRSFGFKPGNIIYMENASKANFETVFGIKGNHKGRLYNYVKPGESDVFIYYSGHGAPDPESKNPYFVPVDCDPQLVALSGYSQEVLYENLSKVSYKSLSVVVDACFSGASEEGMLVKNISPVFINTKEKLFQDPKVSILTSAKGTEVSSWYPEKQHSLFTYYLVNGFTGVADQDQNHKISLNEIKEYLSEHVTYMARRLNGREQNPQINGEVEKTLLTY
ncbi:caspase family protein [Rapidithrix thailandica]|uniref:Caspase family protein n=1 Tax=Rapidithrix thailandica TaxID=413964 RepID=A0AAW9S1K4_9BACT